MITYTEAVDLMYARVTEIWNAEAATYLGSTPVLLYEGTVDNQTRPTNAPWGRVSEQMALERQAAYGNGREENRSLYRSVGTLYVEIWLPRFDKTSKRAGRRLASVVRSAFRGYNAGGEINFTDHTVRTPENEPNWYRYTVSVTFEFYETD